MDFRIRQTSTASPAEPGGLPLTLEGAFGQTHLARLQIGSGLVPPGLVPERVSCTPITADCVPGSTHELHDSIEQPARLRAQSGRRAAKASRPG